MNRLDFKPTYARWRHGGWYVINIQYPSGAVGCVSRNYPDHKWRIVCDSRPFDERPTFATRDEAAFAEYELTINPITGTTEMSVLTAIFDIDAQLAARQLPTIYDDQALLLLRAADEGGGKVFDDAHALLDLLERRDRVNVDALREAIGSHELTVSGFEQYHTGGGCMALRRVLPSGDYLLITDEEGGSIPTGPAQMVAVGRYNADGECIGGDQNVHTIDVADIPGWVTKQEQI